MITAGPFSQADGAVTISLGPESHLPWHEIAISLEDSNGDPVTTVSAGVLEGAATGIGADKPETFEEPVMLSEDERRWKPFFSAVSSITITPANVPATVFYRVTIINTGA